MKSKTILGADGATKMRQITVGIHGKGGEAGIKAIQQLAGMVQYPAAQGQDEPGLLGQRDEIGGRDHAALRVLPAHQRLGSQQVAGGVHHRLVVQQKLVARQALADIALQRGAR